MLGKTSWFIVQVLPGWHMKPTGKMAQCCFPCGQVSLVLVEVHLLMLSTDCQSLLLDGERREKNKAWRRKTRKERQLLP